MRVCRNTKGAETRALDDARLVMEIYEGKVDLKSPKQIPVQV